MSFVSSNVWVVQKKKREDSSVDLIGNSLGRLTEKRQGGSAGTPC